MKILYGHCLPDPIHPAARMVHAIAAELTALGDVVHIHEPDVAGKGTGATAVRAGAAAPKRFQRLRNLFWFAKTIRHDQRAMATDLAAIRRIEPDVVIARHDAYRGSLIRAARAAGVPVVVYADAPVAHEIRHWSDDSAGAKRFHPPGLVEWYEKRHLAMAAAIVAVSEPGRSCLESYGLDVPITVIRNGVDRAFLAPLPDPERRRESRRQLGIESPLVAGFVGTFKPFHGTEMLAELVRRTADWPDLRWVFVGDGPRKHALMQSLGSAASRVTDLGRQPPERLPELYRIMDFTVAPYPPNDRAFHFCPLKILEAQASGAVVLASDRGDIDTMLDHGSRGIVIPGDSVETWIDRLRGLMDDSERTRAIVLQARDFVENHRTWRNSAQELRKMLELVLGPQLAKATTHVPES